jgi:hypothetical protein
VTWQQLGSTVTVNMASSVFMGLAASSASALDLGPATFTNVVIASGPDFLLTSTPATRNYSSGSSTNYFTVSALTFNGLSANVALSTPGLPAGMTSTFVSGSVTATTSDLLEPAFLAVRRFCDGESDPFQPHRNATLLTSRPLRE